ncbi:MAG: GNAT family N-acetyltransferase, partial [Clostridiales bacterium]|nr:GNAT family N-acetyltransferase [Clostridiales bacterium]
MFSFKVSNTLPEDGAYIRKTVFTEEQGFEEEFDEKDGISKHSVLYKDNEAAGVCRFYFDSEKQIYIIGRLAVMKKFRGEKLGAAVLGEAERQIRDLNGESVSLAAQVRAKGFYEKQGYVSIGKEFSEEGCPHIQMYN